MEVREITLAEVLDARERRVWRQQALLSQYQSPLISFTMNIAGPVKISEDIVSAFREGLFLLKGHLTADRIPILAAEDTAAPTGCQAYLAVSGEAVRVKETATALEEHHPLGRFFDIDVLRPDGSKVDRTEIGAEPRKCLLCGKPACVCASRRLHTVQELQAFTRETIRNHLENTFADKIASLAAKALLYEVSVTPKPGLVDRDNSGAHRDMDFYTFLASTTAITPSLRAMTAAGIRTAQEDSAKTFSLLRTIGKSAEAAMRAATGGVNTHKGAIFSVGILCGAAGRLFGRREPIATESILREAGAIAGSALGDCVHKPSTAGEKLYHAYGVTGIRGEAAAGFPTAAQVGLPVLEQALRDGKSPDEAGGITLLHLMASAADTNLMKRASREEQLLLQKNLRERLQRPVTRADLAFLDQDFIRRNLSPGGSADLLAVCWLLHFLAEDPALSNLP